MVCSRKHAVHVGMTEPLFLEDLSTQLANHPKGTYPAVHAERADPLEIIFTSGTTADPKGVVISHGNVLTNIAPLETEIQKYLKYERWVHPVRFLNLLPLSHVFGQFLGLFLPPLMAGTVIFAGFAEPVRSDGTIRRERVSVVVAVPRMLQSLKDKLETRCGKAWGRPKRSAPDFRRRKAGISCGELDFPADAAAIRLEILGIYFGRRGA